MASTNNKDDSEDQDRGAGGRKKALVPKFHINDLDESVMKAVKKHPREDRFSTKIRTVVDLNLNLVPHMLPWKLGSALLLQFILHKDQKDEMNLLFLGFAAGATSLAIVIHASFMTYTLQSFGSVWTYIPERVERVKKGAQIINIALTFIEAVLVMFIFSFCCHFWIPVHEEWKKIKEYGDRDNYTAVTGVNPKYVDSNVFYFTFIVSAVTFGGIVVAILLSIFLICCEGQIYNYLTRKHPRRLGAMAEGRKSIPKSANYIIDEGLATVLMNLFIGIDYSDVGQEIYLRELALLVGMITVVMALLNTIITYAIEISDRDGKLDAIEVKLIQSVHILRYVMAAVQVILLAVMLYQGFITTTRIVPTDSGPFKGPDSLFYLSFVLSLFVAICFVISVIEIIYLKGCCC